jgi:excinuclease ABC subunit A
MDVIKSSDYVVDMGPEGGANGGNVIAKGTPEEVSKNPASYTGKFLHAELN